MPAADEVDLHHVKRRSARRNTRAVEQGVHLAPDPVDRGVDRSRFTQVRLDETMQRESAGLPIQPVDLRTEGGQSLSRRQADPGSAAADDHPLASIAQDIVIADHGKDCAEINGPPG